VAVAFLISVASALLASTSLKTPVWSTLLSAVPFVAVGATAWLTHGSEASARIVTRSIFAAGAIAGCLIVAALLIVSVRDQISDAEQAAAREAKFAEENAAFDAAQFRAVPKDAALWQLYPYMTSPNPEVRKECRERMANRPDLDGELSRNLGNGWAEYTVSYIADIHPSPSAGLAPSYAQFLDAQLVSWRKRLTGDPNPGKWQTNLSPYVRAAERIQRAGGDLRPQLKAWHTYLSTVPGMQTLAAQVWTLSRS
jgi:hypothetical protein